VEIIDLQTQAALKRRDDPRSYSRQLRDWCLEQPDRYLAVGVETPSLRQANGSAALALAEDDRTVFYGIKPVR